MTLSLSSLFANIVRRAAWLAVGFGAALSLVGAERAAVVRTDDGLELSLARDGTADGIRVDGRPLPLVPSPALVYLRDAATNGEFAPVPFTIVKTGNEVQLCSARNVLDLSLTLRVSNRGGFLEFDGDITDRRMVERCIDLRIGLPIDTREFEVGKGLSPGLPAPRVITARKQSKSAIEIDGSGSEANAQYPLFAVSSAAFAAGLTLALPPTHPTRFSLGDEGSGLRLFLKIGISPQSAVPGQTPFRAIAFRHDANWGFRSALERYYDFYREDFFARRVRRIGAWTTQNASKLVHPQLYAYHEAGFPTWRHPEGTESGINVRLTSELLDEGPQCSSLEEYEQRCELALDEKLGLYSLPYTIVGQRQFLQLPRLPASRGEAITVLDTWIPRAPILFDGPAQAGSFRGTDDLKQIIRNSTLHDVTDQLAFLPRPYRGPTLTFPQNPNPNLYQDDLRPTVARYTLDYYLPMMFRSKFIDGCYLDSLGRWCDFNNFRRDHFKYSTVPLTYAGTPARPCIWNLQSHAEYLWELRRRLRAQGKIVVANGVHANRILLGFAADVMGAEGGRTYDAGESFYALRVAAGIKPYCVLNATHRVSPRLWNSCLYMGYLMGCNDPKGLADEAKYLPAIIKCNEASWAPVTHARVTPAAVGVERWGGHTSDDALLFTVMNRSAEPVTARLTIDMGALKRSTKFQASSLIDAITAPLQEVGANVELQFVLQAEQATLLELQPR